MTNQFDIPDVTQVILTLAANDKSVAADCRVTLRWCDVYETQVPFISQTVDTWLMVVQVFIGSHIFIHNRRCLMVIEFVKAPPIYSTALFLGLLPSSCSQRIIFMKQAYGAVEIPAHPILAWCLTHVCSMLTWWRRKNGKQKCGASHCKRRWQQNVFL